MTKTTENLLTFIGISLCNAAILSIGFTYKWWAVLVFVVTFYELSTNYAGGKKVDGPLQ